MGITKKTPVGIEPATCRLQTPHLNHWPKLSKWKLERCTSYSPVTCGNGRNIPKHTKNGKLFCRRFRPVSARFDRFRNRFFEIRNGRFENSIRRDSMEFEGHSMRFRSYFETGLLFSCRGIRITNVSLPETTFSLVQIQFSA